ncbi:MAG: serine hydrolase [Deltaproteobacteria bacterium]|nr:serine hydrolase [Deltaproteobacteria bacterium]
MRRVFFTIFTLVLAFTITIIACKVEGFDASRIGLLRARIMDGAFKDINSILVVKQGKVLIEEYFNGEDPDTLHDIRSAGKSITSALVGIAIDKGLVRGVDEKLLSYFPGVECHNGWDPRKESITLKDVLSMSFGLAEPGEYPSWENRNWYTENWIGDVLCQPIEYEPGSRFDYDSSAPALFGPIIEQSSGMSVGRFAEDFLFRPLGIEHYRWHILPDGREYTGGGFHMRPRDMAKLGQLYLQKGAWKGKQLVSKKWVEESTRSHMAANARLERHYGYYWWREKFLIGEGWIETYFASGNGGNKIYVFPSEDLVVVISASAYNRSYGHPQVRMMMNKSILPAVIQSEHSHPGEPVLKTVPQIGFLISEFVFLVTLVLCILWPSAFLSKPLRTEQAVSADSNGNRKWPCLFRIWIGINALIGIIFVGIVLGEANTLDLLLNCGYAQPICPALHKVMASWAITILTAGSLVLTVKSWRGRYWSNMASGYFSIFAFVSLYCVFSLGYLGLLFFVC